MMDDRRYEDDEVAEIFEAAAAAPEQRQPAPESSQGLTLAELQAIGRDVGVSPARIAEAAAALELNRSSTPRRSHLGMPTSAGRTVPLARALTDREWGVLVGELRETFGARGRDLSHGDVREWANGNLHVCVEPAETGYRLRMQTLKRDGAAVNRMGAASVVMGGVLAIAMFLSGQPTAEFMGPSILGSLGAGSLAYNALRLPRWAAERERQMQHLAARALALIGPADPKPSIGAPARHETDPR